MSDPQSQQLERRKLRKTMRQRRRSLTLQQQQVAAQQLLRILRIQPLFRRSKHIAVYLAEDGELDLGPIIAAAWASGKCVYLPVLRPLNKQRMWFVRYHPYAVLQRNYLRILEPRMAGNRPFPATCLDLVLTPLVAFDRSGARLGMGGGFYDRAFAFKKNSASAKPYLLGVAHSCQEIDSLPLQSWDIPLHGIATDGGIIPCKANHQRDFVSGSNKKSAG